MFEIKCPVYPIIDDSFLPVDPQARDTLLSELARGFGALGVTILQYRNKQGTDPQLLSDARCLRAAAPPTLKLILNDRADLVRQAGFEGVHVGQQDTSVHAARVLLGPDAIIGVSTHNPNQLRVADASAADYLAIGPIFATATKENPDPVVGLDGLRRARALTQKPLVAIGGMTLANAHAVRSAGADALAVISALFHSRGPADNSPLKIAEDFLAVFR
jgi:thiamine-phosphate pyrophosphorylase